MTNTAAATWTADPATAKQVTLIIKLIGWVLADEYIAGDIADGLFRNYADVLGFDPDTDPATATKGEASKMIGSLKSIARKPQTSDEIHNAADAARNKGF